MTTTEHNRRRAQARAEALAYLRALHTLPRRTNYPRQSIAATKNTTQPPQHQPLAQLRPTVHPVGLAFSSASSATTTPPTLPARPRPRQSPPKTTPPSLPTG